MLIQAYWVAYSVLNSVGLTSRVQVEHGRRHNVCVAPKLSSCFEVCALPVWTNHGIAKSL